MTDPTPLRAPRIRRAPIPDDAVLAVRFLRRFPDWGRYGLSADYARNTDESGEPWSTTTGSTYPST